MLVVNCKVELKLKWSCVLSVAGVANVNGNNNDNFNGKNIIFTIKDTKLMSLSSLYRQETIKNYQKF